MGLYASVLERGENQDHAPELAFWKAKLIRNSINPCAWEIGGYYADVFFDIFLSVDASYAGQYNAPRWSQFCM